MNKPSENLNIKYINQLRNGSKQYHKANPEYHRQDAGINGDAQRIEQMTWMFFLKVYDTQEETWEYKDENYKSIIPEELRWRNWAIDKKTVKH